MDGVRISDDFADMMERAILSSNKVQLAKERRLTYITHRTKRTGIVK